MDEGRSEGSKRMTARRAGRRMLYDLQHYCSVLKRRGQTAGDD